MSATAFSAQIPLFTAPVAWREIDGEAVIVECDAGEVTMLDPVGTSMWKLVDGKRTVDDIVQGVTEQFEADPAQVEVDCQAIFKDLERFGVLKYKEL